MVFLRSITSSEPDPIIQGERVYLRAPALTDFQAWVELRNESAKFLKPWEPLWPHDDLTRGAYRLRIKRYARDMRDDLSYPFFIFAKSDNTLLGGLTVSNIRRGVAQTGSLGYWIGSCHAEHGYMTDAVRSFLQHGFGDLRLNRIEAACLPTNAPSIKLLNRCGFTREGYARAYLKIEGKWQDHLLFAILSTDPRP